MTTISGWDLPKTLAGVPKFDMSNVGEIALTAGDLKARTDIANPLTSKFLNCDANGHLEVNIIGRDNAGDGSLHNVKVNDNGELFTQLRPTHYTALPTLNNAQGHGLLMDTKARLLTKSTLSGLTDIDDETTVKNVKIETSGAIKVNNEEINKGNSSIASGGSLQQVLIYGKKNDGTLEPLECNGDRLLVDVVELAQSGAISTSTSLSAVQICGEGDDNKFKTLSTDNNGVLKVNNANITDGSQVTKCMGNNGSGQTQILVDNAGVAVVQNQPTRGQLQISTANISTWNDNAYCDTVTMGNFQVLTIHISCVSSALDQTKVFMIEGSDDGTNFYPYRQIKPQDGLSNDFYKCSILMPYERFRIQNRTGANQPLHNSDGAFYMLSNGSGNGDLDKDSTNKLNVVALIPISRGTITMPSPFGSGATSSSVDVGDNQTINFHFEGSFTALHTGFILQGSNDNSNWYKTQLFTPSTVGTQVSLRGSLTRGFRYYRVENGGDSCSVTTSIYNAYN